MTAKNRTDEVLDALESSLDGIASFKAQHRQDLAELQAQVDDVQKMLQRPGALSAANAGGSGASGGKRLEQWIDTKSHQLVPVLDRADSIKALHTKATDEPDISIGRFLRGVVLGGRAHDHQQLTAERKNLQIGIDPAGGYTVGGALAREWIDLLRAKMVLQQAGCRTVPMETGELTIARLTGDPTVQWHGEAADINASDPTFGAVRLKAKTVLCLTKFSLELAQDSANLEAILTSSMTSALAQAIDSAGLVGVTVDAAAAPGGIFELTGRNTVTAIGAPTSWDWLIDGMFELLADNVAAEDIGAMIAHPALWKKMRKLKTGISGDNSPLTMPEEVRAMPKLWTTGAPLTGGTTAKAVIGDWRDLLMGVRKDISIKVLNERFLGDTLEIGMLIYARVDFVATRAVSFCTLEDISV